MTVMRFVVLIRELQEAEALTRVKPRLITAPHILHAAQRVDMEPGQQSVNAV